MTVRITLHLDDEDYSATQNARDILDNIRRMLPETEVKAIEIDISAAQQPPDRSGFQAEVSTPIEGTGS